MHPRRERRTPTFFIAPGVLLRLLVGGEGLHLQHLVDLPERHQPESALVTQIRKDDR